MSDYLPCIATALIGVFLWLYGWRMVWKNWDDWGTSTVLRIIGCTLIAASGITAGIVYFVAGGPR